MTFNPSAGRFLSMDPYLGSDRRPATLHRYLYANADPVNNFDPSGEITAAAIGPSLGGYISMATNIFRTVSLGLRVADGIQTAVGIVNLFTNGLPNLVQFARQAVADWATALGPGVAAPQTRRLFDADLWSDAADMLAQASPDLVRYMVTRFSGEIVSRFAAFRAQPFHFVVYMPTPYERTIPNPERWIMLPGATAFLKAPVVLRFGGGGTSGDENRGRLFGFGYVYDKEMAKPTGQGKDRQFFRMDYHDFHAGYNAKDTILQYASTARYKFHFHVRPR